MKRKSKKQVEKDGVKTYNYVVVGDSGDVYKRDDGTFIFIQAESEAEALKLAQAKYWDEVTVRMAGDESRIAAIERYADSHYKVGRLDAEIEALQTKRTAVVTDARPDRDLAYQLPEEDLSF